MDSLDTTFAALADPTRRANCTNLMRREATVNDLVDQLDLAQPRTSSHIKVLETAGLIARARVAQARSCRLKLTGLKTIFKWLKDYERFWEETIDRFVHPYLGRKS